MWRRLPVIRGGYSLTVGQFGTHADVARLSAPKTQGASESSRYGSRSIAYLFDCYGVELRREHEILLVTVPAPAIGSDDCHGYQFLAHKKSVALRVGSD